MTPQRLDIAVVGHTNTGKTSLLRTLLRDVQFGEVSDRPAVTRDVQGAIVQVRGQGRIELFDTPGLEDSIGLLEHLEAMRGGRPGRRMDGLDLIQTLLASDEARGAFAQEAKALRQVLASDVALYVVDARDRVLGKHRDELAILGMCARPIVPVLNFVADPAARTEEWRAHLRRANMHAVAEFDTVVFDAAGERRLLEKIRSLLDEHRQTIDALIAERADQRRSLIRSSSVMLAELLVDVASLVVELPRDDEQRAKDAVERLKSTVRHREQRAVEQLLALHRFRPVDASAGDLPIEGGAWGIDLFSPQALKQFGITAGSGAAVGGVLGLMVDVALGGLSLGTAGLAGATIGGLIGGAGSHGRRLMHRMRGRTELRVDEATLRLLTVRQYALVRALLIRGHASMQAVTLGPEPPERPADLEEITRTLRTARAHPAWSRLDPDRRPALDDPDRLRLVEEIAGALQKSIGAG